MYMYDKRIFLRVVVPDVPVVEIMLATTVRRVVRRSTVRRNKGLFSSFLKPRVFLAPNMYVYHYFHVCRFCSCFLTSWSLISVVISILV